jgi:hypothetical protein
LIAAEGVRPYSLWEWAPGRIANLHFHLIDKPLLRGTGSIAEGWAAGELAGLRQKLSERR